MNRHGPRVVIGWAAGQAALVVILAGFGGTAFELWLYACAVGITTSMAVAMLISTFRHPLPRRRHRVSTRGEVGMAVAATATMFGLAGAYGTWFVPIAVPLLVMSIWLATRRASRAAP